MSTALPQQSASPLKTSQYPSSARKENHMSPYNHGQKTQTISFGSRFRLNAKFHYHVIQRSAFLRKLCIWGAISQTGMRKPLACVGKRWKGSKTHNHGGQNSHTSENISTGSFQLPDFRKSVQVSF
eukprot:TRINITY_DN6351_c0_g1_i1.p1 TRINITY_DN6351_c0_g1~~TRINITY_DN6351_c0_g1_i1.p1  ORF type:complete len:126 (+),score=8.68 TRINITY_DN6351_c0_g1_i1:672-1049(+)